MTGPLSTDGRDTALLFGRVLLVALYAISGVEKLGQIGGIAQALGSKGVPLPLVSAWIGTGIEIAGAIGIVLGFRTRIAALALILFTALATILFHNYWAFPAEARDGQFIHFFKNVGLVGGFLLLIGAGPGRFSIDQRGAGGRLPA